MLTFLWGLFCACSWTWCIGMFLPKLMIDRFGWWGFIAFAVPNVIGCTAFGYVVKNRSRSEAMVRRHQTAMIVFSSITIGYHLFFTVWLLDSIVQVPQAFWTAPLGSAAIVFALAGLFSFFPDRDWLGLGVLVYAVSLLAFWNVGFEGFQRVPWGGALNPAALILLTPALLFGFLLCPYLDLTFHRAIQRTPSRHSFAVFGATFTVMILLTVAIWFGTTRWEAETFDWLPPIVMAHLFAQMVFTAGAHMREIRVSPISGVGRVTAIFAPLSAALLLYLGRMLTDSPALGETNYMAILSLYASVFPGWLIWNALRARERKAPGGAGG